jgi:hypothetical protein
MNILEFILAVSVGVVVLAVAADISSQIWAEKREARKARWVRMREAEALLYASITKRFEGRLNAQTRVNNVIELTVVALPKKPVGGRHRLSVA